MADANGGAARVVFPDRLDEIEAELGRRRHPSLRNLTRADIAQAEKHGVTLAEYLHAENTVHGVIGSTVEQRILAKAAYWGMGLVTCEMADLELLGGSEIERRYHEGG